VLLEWGKLMHSNGPASYSCALGAGRSVRVRILADAGAPLGGGRLWRSPGRGRAHADHQLARLFRSVAMLLKGGIPVVSALGMVRSLLHPALRARLDLAIVASGKVSRRSQAMSTNEHDDSGALRLLRVGERSGNLGDMMAQIADFHDEEMARWTEWFTRSSSRC
jgi:general secretion pathway protein F